MMSKFLCKDSAWMNYLLTVWSLIFFNSTFAKFRATPLKTNWKHRDLGEFSESPTWARHLETCWVSNICIQFPRKENVFSAPLTTPSRQISFVVMTPHKKCAKNFQWITFFRVLRKNSLKNRFLLFFVMSSAKHETWGKAH